MRRAKDKTTFNRSAETFNKLVGGQGENWLKVAAMGYALDSGNTMYAAGKSAMPAAAEEEPTKTPEPDLDFEIGQPTAGATTDISFEPVEAEVEQTSMMEPGAMRSMAGEAEQKVDEDAPPLMPDFTLDMPEAGAPTQTDISLDAYTPEASNIDFNVELPNEEPASGPTTVVDVTSAKKNDTSDSMMDFKIDMDGISLNLDDTSESPPVAAEGDKDAHWYDVQTKFDLAKAYQEMGDKDGAKEILQEVIKEGDAGQQTEAKKLLGTLG